jgi:hypothetical protein
MIYRTTFALLTVLNSKQRVSNRFQIGCFNIRSSPFEPAASLERISFVEPNLNNIGRRTSHALLMFLFVTVQEPIVLGTWLKPGVHLDLVGAFTLEMRETDDEVRKGGERLRSRWENGTCDLEKRAY